MRKKSKENIKHLGILIGNVTTILGIIVYVFLSGKFSLEIGHKFIPDLIVMFIEGIITASIVGFIFDYFFKKITIIKAMLVGISSLVVHNIVVWGIIGGHTQLIFTFDNLGVIINNIIFGSIVSMILYVIFTYNQTESNDNNL
jgi:hypothetical protein